jgi:hypothetical protein
MENRATFYRRTPMDSCVDGELTALLNLKSRVMVKNQGRLTSTSRFVQRLKDTE